MVKIYLIRVYFCGLKVGVNDSFFSSIRKTKRVADETATQATLEE